MNHPAASQPFVPLFESSRRPAPGLSSSIWAPQPQPSDNTWSKAIESISRANEDHLREPSRPEFRRAMSNPTNNGGEDVFGTAGAAGIGGQDKRTVGAIGDGRKRSTPDYDPMVRSCTIYFRCFSAKFLVARSPAASYLEPQLSCSICSGVLCYGLLAFAHIS